ncbi:MAG TPA: tetratricopeptide repeat protein [Gemmataceae bacterium]|nr:tetratricopeptide repeat protein [Gemmataceae bacterium]
MTPHRLALALLSFSLAAAAVAQPPKPPAPSADEKNARESFAAGKLDDALKSLQAAAKANPALVPRVLISRWFLEANQGQQARVWLERAAIDEPAHPAVLLTNGMYAMNEGRITDGILSCEAALQAAASPRWDADARKSFQRDARVGLLAGYNYRGDMNSARTQLVALLEADPKNPRFRTELARANFALGKPDDALAELTKARQDDMTLDRPELGMAQFWAAKGDFPKAEEWFGKAAQAYPTEAAVHRGYAGYLLDRGRVDAAKAHLEAARKIEPTARETKALAGLMARYQKDMATATAVFEELVREYPNQAFGIANLALVLSESVDANNKRRAVELAEGYVRQNQRTAEAHAIYGYTLLKNDRVADAEKAVMTAASLGSLTPDSAYFLARVLTQKERIEEAHKVLKDALASQGAFVYRADAQALFNDLDKKVPPPKKP